MDCTPQEYVALTTKLLEVQKILLEESENIRACLAVNPFLIPELQILLAKDKYARVRKCLVLNRNLCPEALFILLPELYDFILNRFDWGYAKYNYLTKQFVIDKINVMKLLD